MTAPSRASAGNPADVVRLVPGAFRRTDSGNAERFAALHRGAVHWVPGHEHWLIWGGERWELDTGDTRIGAVAKATVRAIWDEANACGDLEDRKRLQEWAAKSEAAGKRAALVSLAKSEPGIAIDVSSLDRDPWLLNCRNGTLDLRTGELRAHRREDFITKTTGVLYEKNAWTDLWDRTLHNMTGGDAELGEYLQRVAGYSLTGHASEKKFFFLHGPPDSGKSSFILAMLACMGDYAESTQFDTWLQRPNVGGNRDDLVDLRGVRLVTSAEVQRNAKWDTALLKQVTGGDRIKASAKFEKQISFRATCTLILAANDAPRAPDDDDGFWSRMQRVPITHVVPVEERIKDFAAVLAAPENAAAILAWAVEGCKRWQEKGIGTSNAVDVSTSDYREENDWLAGFLELFEVDELSVIPPAQMRDIYKRFCDDEGQRPDPTKTLANRIARRLPEVRYKVVQGKRMWCGLRLRSELPTRPGLPGMPPDERFE